MQKRYQVFISSTYDDLRDVRQEVSQALLRAECFPAAMELFPAADEGVSGYIKEVIDQSDYYLLISAGRYGSIERMSGLSYTELEYDYAVERGKPVIRLLHKDPMNRLTGDRIERTDSGRAALERFRAKVSSGGLVRFWTEPSELMAEVVFGIMDARQRKPATGWVRADGRASEEAEIEIARARQRIAELELELARRERDSFDPAARLALVEELLPVDGGEFPLRDACTTILVMAYAETNKDSILVSAKSFLFRNFSVAAWLRDHASEEFLFDMSVARLEALGLARFRIAHRTGRNGPIKVPEVEITEATRPWVASLMPFNDARNFTAHYQPKT
jgi:hypothetical protein